MLDVNFSFAEHEAERLQALHRLKILDTPPEAAYDRVTRLASRLFKVPIALVSLVDENRQWFKSCIGLDGTLQTPRDIAFCAHAVEADAPLVVPDATQDARFASNPLVTQSPFVRFYAGAPIRTREGAPLGTLCLIDSKPRAFDEKDLELLVELAAFISDEVARRQDEIEARGAEQRLRTLIQNTSDLITILDANGLVRYQSPAIAAMLGYAPDELVGTGVFDLVHPDDVTECSAALRDMVASGERLAPLTYRFRHRDGSWRILESVARSGLNDPNIAGIVISSRDVTERQQTQDALRDSEEQLRLALDSGNMGVWKFDEQGIVWWSQSMERVHGLAPGSFDGHIETFLGVVHPDDRAEVQRVSGEAAAGRAFAFEYRMAPQSETEAVRWLEARGVPVHNDEGKITHVVGLSTDITERKAIEQSLREEAEHLETLARVQNSIALSEYDLDKVLEEVVLSTLRLTGAEGVSFLTIEGDSLVQSAGAGLAQNHLDARVMLDGSLSGRSAREDRVLRCNDTETDPRVDREACRRVGVRSILAAPLRHGRRAAWVLAASSQKAHAFSERDEQTLDFLRGLCAAVISRAIEFDAKQDALKLLSESERRKTAIVETALDCIVSIDSQSRILEWNPAAEHTFGWTREEATQSHLYELIVPPELREAHRHGMEKYLATGEGPILGRRVELPSVRKDGARIVVELAVVAIPHMQPPLFTGHMRDITVRKETEAALEAAKTEAETQRENAERANAAKSEFLSRMSHELRTPLNAILGFGQLLEFSDLAPDDQESTEQILKAGNHLLGLINEVLDIARIEAGNLSLSLEPVEVAGVCAEALALVRPAAAARNLALHDETALCELFVQADRQRLRQILLNLLSNAVKYNGENGEVRLHCSQTENRVRICVSDDGPGIAPEKAARLFTPFDRLDAEQTNIEGTGIGLSLSRHLAEAMDGTLDFDRTPPTEFARKGSTFWVELPLATGEVSGDEELKDSQNERGRSDIFHTVLHIEDNRANQQLVARLLQRRGGIELLAATDGMQGLEMAQTSLPDLILLDLHLPSMSGNEVLEVLQGNPATRAIPVVMISADVTPGQIERTVQNGARAYLSKPLDVRHFFRLVDQILLPKEDA